MSRDLELLDLFERHRIFTESETRSLKTHWRTVAESGESLADLLIRLGILSPQYESTLKLISVGVLKIVKPRSLLTSRGKDRFDELLASFEPKAEAESEPEPQPTTKSYTSLLNAPPSVIRTAMPAPAPAPTSPSGSTDSEPEAGKRNTSRPSLRRVGLGSHANSIGTTSLRPVAAPSTPINGMPKVGDTVGKCLLTAELARGASAVVFEALHTSLQVPVAMKVFMPAGASADDRLRRQFSDEALLLARLNHPNMVRILDYEDGDFPYLVLEFVNGFSLNELINNSGFVAIPQATQAILRTAEALAYAHAQKVIHRDVKPANIMIDREGLVKLADLGISRITTAISRDENQRTHANRLCGTPAYVAPEQAFSPDNVDGRADIYSLGATWYHAITGMLPFEAKTSQEMILKHVSTKPVAPHLIRTEVPRPISDMILKMMAKKPEDRFPSMNDVVDEIRMLMNEVPGLNPNATATTRTASSAMKRSTGSITVILQRSLTKILGKSRS